VILIRCPLRALLFGEGGADVERHPRRWVAQNVGTSVVDIEREQADTAILQRLDHSEAVRDGAKQPVEPCRHDDIARAQSGPERSMRREGARA
jgi:hypothetical protein